MTDRALQLDAEVDLFIAENPHVWKKFRMLACKLKAKGVDRWSCKNLFEVLRWDHAITSNSSADSFVLNNNYTSRFARRLLEEEDFEGFFEVRRLRGGEPD